MDKAALRKKILAKRIKNNLQSDKFLENLLQLPDFNNARNIGSYSSIHGEISTDSINSFILKSNKNLYLPFSTAENISFSKITYETPLEMNKKTHIFEPLKFDEDFILDFLIIPSMACDKTGNRLGRGLGWYDRFISSHKKRSNNLVIAAILDENELFESFDFVEEHDQKVDVILTEKQIYFCND